MGILDCFLDDFFDLRLIKIFKRPDALEEFFDRVSFFGMSRHHFLEDSFIAHCLLIFLHSGKMHIDGGQLHWHGAFEKFSCLPVFLISVLLHLVSSPIIDHSNFSPSQSKDVSALISFDLLAYFLQGHPLSENAMFMVKNHLNQLLVSYVSFPLVHYHKH
eukprot:CAMPEP_0170563552 /NCGR_PEP_ID=MMETSP0211-20121228/67360_1 /TAXON_ID=311385 /ORGANISM="Pseudokeronopsis sp., Strain OXSARD2" /LENGTH=159 /DNA_ID=CAMNT_0010881929 /DNA_START=385 /DNA_END=864 /DNA_ORIENTATION=+